MRGRSIAIHSFKGGTGPRVMSSIGRYSPNGLKRFISILNSIRFRDDVGQVEYLGRKVVIL